MSAAKHTPGPWFLKPASGVRSLWRVLDAAGRVIGTISRTFVEVDRADADARLIAAAPDLLFQLLSASNYIDALGGDSKSYRAAIAKATGGEA